MPKKWRELTLSCVSDVKLKSTRDLVKEVSKKSGKAINWTGLFRTLKELADDNYIKCYETSAGFFWIKENLNTNYP